MTTKATTTSTPITRSRGGEPRAKLATDDEFTFAREHGLELDRGSPPNSPAVGLARRRRMASWRFRPANVEEGKERRQGAGHQFHWLAAVIDSADFQLLFRRQHHRPASVGPIRE